MKKLLTTFASTLILVSGIYSSSSYADDVVLYTPWKLYSSSVEYVKNIPYYTCKYSRTMIYSNTPTKQYKTVKNRGYACWDIYPDV